LIDDMVVIAVMEVRLSRLLV